MNEELLNTNAVISAVKRYLEHGLDIGTILDKLEDIHNIVVTPIFLEKWISETFINTNKLNKNVKKDGN